MAVITTRFGSGGANLTPGGQGEPTLANTLRDVADDLALSAGSATSRWTEETVPVDSNDGLLYGTAEVVEFVEATAGGSAGVKAIRRSAATPGAGECIIDTDRRTVTFAAADAVTEAVVGYLAEQQQAAYDESDAETFALTDAWTLTVKVDGGAEETATFNTGDFVDIGAATAAEVAAVLNTDISGQTSEARGGKVVMRSDTTGPDSSIEVTGGTAATALGFSGDIQSGAGLKTIKG